MLRNGPGQQMGEMFPSGSEKFRPQEQSCFPISVDMQPAGIDSHDAGPALLPEIRRTGHEIGIPVQ